MNTMHYLPAVLTFPGTKQNSISVERALKNIQKHLYHLAADGVWESEAGLQVAFDDLELLISAVGEKQLPTPNASKPALAFPKTLALCKEQNIKLYLDGCKVVVTQAGKWCLVSPIFGAGYFGTFDTAGNFKPTRDCKQSYLDQLAAVEERGIDAIKEIGLATGRCCVCGRTLTAEGSIEDGIGPICAGKLSGGEL